jgi:hypothetical protein
MKRNHVVLDFVRLLIAQEVEFTKNVIARTRANPKFSGSPVPVDELEAKLSLLETRSIDAQGGGKEATALMHQTEVELLDMLRKVGRYVDLVADGDEAIILSSGFNLSKQPAPSSRPDFSVELGEKPHSVLLHCKAQEGVKAYIWQYLIGDAPSANDADWVTAQVTSKTQAELTGLTPLTKYWFRFAVVTATRTGPFCSPIMQVVI